MEDTLPFPPIGVEGGPSEISVEDAGEVGTSIGYGRSVGNTVLGGTKLEQTIHNSYAALDDNVIHEHWRDPNNAIIDLILEFPYDKAADENQSDVAVYPLDKDTDDKHLDYTRRIRRTDCCQRAHEGGCHKDGVVGHGFCKSHLDYQEHVDDKHLFKSLGNECNCILSQLNPSKVRAAAAAAAAEAEDEGESVLLFKTANFKGVRKQAEDVSWFKDNSDLQHFQEVNGHLTPNMAVLNKAFVQLKDGVHDKRCKTVHGCMLNVNRKPYHEDLYRMREDTAGPKERRKSMSYDKAYKPIKLPAPLESLADKMNEVLERHTATGFRRMRDVFNLQRQADSMSCFGRSRRAGGKATAWLASCLPDIQGFLGECLEDVVAATDENQDKLRILPEINLRHLLVDVLLEKGFIVKPLFQENEILLFISAPLSILMEQAQGKKIAIPLKNQLWSEQRPDKSGQPSCTFFDPNTGKKKGSALCASLGNVLLEPARPPKKREYKKELGRDGQKIPKPDQEGYRYGEVPWDVGGRVVHVRSHAPITVCGAELYGEEKFKRFTEQGVDGAQSHKNEADLVHILVDDTHLKVEDYKTYYKGLKENPPRFVKSGGGLTLPQMQNWCKDVLELGEEGKDLTDFLQAKNRAEGAVAYLHLETAITFAMKAKHGKYLKDLKDMFKRQVRLGMIEMDGAAKDIDEVEDASEKRQFNHFVIQEVRYLMQHDCCRTMTWPAPNLIVGELLQQVLNDLKKSNASGVIFYHEKSESEALPASMFWIDPVLPAILIGPRSARRIDGAIKGYGIDEETKLQMLANGHMVGAYPKVEITRPTHKRADPRTQVPYRFETKYKHAMKHGFVHIEKSQSRSNLKSDTGTYTQVADGALWTMRRQMLTIESLQRLDLDVEHSRRMLADDRDRAGRYGGNLLFDVNNYKFRDYNAIHSKRTMHVADRHLVPLEGAGQSRALVPANFQWMLANGVFSDYILPHDEDYVFDKLLIKPTAISLQAEYDALEALGYRILDTRDRETKEHDALGASFEDYGHENRGMIEGSDVEKARRLNIQVLTEQVTTIREELRIDDRMREIRALIDEPKLYEELRERKKAAADRGGRGGLSSAEETQMKGLKKKLASKGFDDLLKDSRRKNLRAGITWKYFESELKAQDNVGQNWAKPTGGLSQDVLKSRSQMYHTFWGVLSTHSFNPFKDFLWRPNGDLPIPWIRRYFGEHYTLYLVWSQTLNQTMWVPVIAGLAATVWGLYNLLKKPFCEFDPVTSTMILAPYLQLLPSPDGEKLECPTRTECCTEICEIPCREKSLPVVLEELTNNGATPIFAVVICIWCAFFLEKWVRRENHWAAYWHTAKGKWLYSNPSRLRPGFRATVKPPGAEMTVPQGYESFGSRMKKLFWSYTLILSYIVVVIGCVVAVMLIRVQLGLGLNTGEVFDKDRCKPAVDSGNSTTTSTTSTSFLDTSTMNATSDSNIIDEAIETFVPSAIQAFFIFIFSIIYGKIAHFLTALENHRTQADYNNHYIVKLFLFQMVNYFTGLYYIAFFRQGLNSENDPDEATNLFGCKHLADSCGVNGDCMGLLSMQVLILVVSMPLFKILKENTIPYLMRKLRLNEPRTWWELEQSLTASPSTTSIRISSDTTVDEFVNKIMMYGIVTMFAVSMPLAPLFFFGTNWLDFLFIGTRRLKNSRRTLAMRSDNIGHWNTILLFINGLAVLTNGFLMIITGEEITDGLEKYSETNERYLLGEHSEAYALVLFEHTILLIMFLMHIFIPNMPRSIEFKHYATARAVRRHYNQLTRQEENIEDASNLEVVKTKKLMPTLYRAAASFATRTQPSIRFEDVHHASVRASRASATLRRRSNFNGNSNGSDLRSVSAPAAPHSSMGSGTNPGRTPSERYRLGDDYEDAWIDRDRDGVVTDAEIEAAMVAGNLGFGGDMEADYQAAVAKGALSPVQEQPTATSFGFDEGEQAQTGKANSGEDSDSDLNI